MARPILQAAYQLEIILEWSGMLNVKFWSQPPHFYHGC